MIAAILFAFFQTLFFDTSIKENGFNQTVLTWTASTEGVFNCYTIERSADGITWQTIDTVPEDVTGKYVYTDNSILFGLWYYRIKANQAGNPDYSRVLRINYELKPIRQVVVYDALGRRHWMGWTNNIRAQLQPGKMYLVKYIDTGDTEKIYIQNR